jgi:hypothetical protein
MRTNAATILNYKTILSIAFLIFMTMSCDASPLATPLDSLNPQPEVKQTVDEQTLQTGNAEPVRKIILKDAKSLSDTRIGSLVSGCYRNPATDWLGWSQEQKKDGFTRARITLNASDGPAVDNTFLPLENEIPQEYIEIYRQLKKLGIDTRYSLSFWDLQHRHDDGSINQDRLSSDEEIERYLDYVKMVAASLKGLVGGYELWNEPDANYDFYQRIKPEDYLKAARLAIPLIRQIDPQAKIVIGATSSYIDKEVQEYSRLILESDIVALGDIISLHTVNNDSSPVFKSEYYYGYDDMWKAIKQTAAENGFRGEYIADELNYRSTYSLEELQPEIGDYHPYEPEIAAKYIGRMIAINLGLDVSVGTSGTNAVERPIEGQMIRNMAFILEGLRAVPVPVIVNSDEELIRVYTFVDQDKNQYAAVWIDDAAKKECKGVEAALVVRDIQAKSVLAMDPFLSIEQTIQFQNLDDGVEINQILLKDYPILFKIVKE